MADKNKNGIDDSKEGVKKAVKGYVPTTVPTKKPDPKLEKREGTISALGGRRFGGMETAPVSQSRGAAPGKTGMMKFAPGMAGPGRLAPAQPDPFSLFDRPRQQMPMEAEEEMSFADYLQQAMGMLGGMGGSGGGGGGGVNYGPQRDTLRQNAATADSRLEAMYRQLRGSIDADAPVIQKGFDEAQASTQAATKTAVDQTQAASDAAQSRNSQVLASLGIQAAEGNQIQEGRDLGTQTAGAIASQATTGQLADNRLAAGESAALSHNTNIGNAAGLEGNLQRAANQSRLQQLLAEIDMKEQQDNASMAASAGGGGPDFSSMLQVANQLYGYDRDKQEREDNLAIQGAKMAQSDAAREQKAAVQYDPNKFNAWLSQAVGLDNLPEDPFERARAMNYYRQVFTGR